MRHFKGPKKRSVRLGIDAAMEGKSSSLTSALVAAIQMYREAGVTFALAGGLAVAAHGYSRFTDDLDFLVNDAAFHTKGLILTFAPGIPIAVGDIPVDNLPIEGEDAEALAMALGAANADPDFLYGTIEVPVLPVEALIMMKLRSGRARDLGDVAELIAIHGAEDTVEFLTDAAPDLIPVLERIIARIE